MKFKTNCAYCGAEIMRRKTKSGNSFCNNKCKGLWQIRQRENLGFTKGWLINEYIVNGKSANQIAREIGRDPKRVWEWLRFYNIPTRKRGTDYGQGFKDGHKLGVGRVQKEETKEKIRQKCIDRGSVPCMVNGIHWMKYYNRRPASYKGGTTHDRQKLYATEQWKNCVKIVWKRDNATCQLCNGHQNDNRSDTFQIHHIIPFNHKDHRIEIDNLILLCRSCHLWVHSNKNGKKILIKEV